MKLISLQYLPAMIVAILSLASPAYAMPVQIFGTVVSSKIVAFDSHWNATPAGSLLPDGSEFRGSFEYDYIQDSASNTFCARISDINLSFSGGVAIHTNLLAGFTQVTPDSVKHYDLNSLGLTLPTLPQVSFSELQALNLVFANPSGTSINHPDFAVDIAKPNFDYFLTRTLFFAGDFDLDSQSGVPNHKFDVFARIDGVSVPEPATLGFMVLGLLATYVTRRKKNHFV